MTNKNLKFLKQLKRRNKSICECFTGLGNLFIKEGKKKLAPTASVKVEINQDEIKKYIEDEVQKQINQQLLLVDITKLSQLTSMSPRYLEEYIISDPRVRLHERRRDRKRWWIYEPTIKAIISIINDW